MMKTIQINNFSSLHDDVNIIFCKTELLESEFEKIKKFKNDVILISGNSDFCIDDNIFNKRPDNIYKWFGQNALVNHEILEPLPIGIENRFPSIREGHGIGWGDSVEIKERMIYNSPNIIPDKFIYSNFNVNTNHHHRSQVREICINTDFIDWEEPNLSIEGFFRKILDYQLIVCPTGNGIDTHRLWEVLYSNRIPITFKIGDYNLYKLYEKLPVIILDNITDLENLELLTEKHYNAKINFKNLEMIDCDYWVNKILTC